jgi:hypothetical protein
MKKLLLNSKSFVIAFVIGNLFLFGVTTGFAATRTASVSGNWNATATWGGAAVPTSADDVIINSGITVTVTANAAANSITFPLNNAASSTVTINAGFTLTVTGSITIPRAANPRINTLAVGAGILTAGSIDFTNSGGAVRHKVTISTGTITVGNVTADAGSTGSASITFSGAGLLKVSGTIFTNAMSTFTQSTGTVEYNGAAQTIGDFTYNNLTLSGSGAKTIPTATTVNGKLSLQGTATATGTAPTYGAASTLEYAGSAAQTATAIEFPAAGGPFNLTLNNAAGATIGFARTIAGTVTLTSGILSIAAPNTLTLSTSTAIAGGPFSATKHINTQVSGATQGFLRVNAIAQNAAYLFPVGNGTYYLPTTVTPTSATVADNTYSVGVFKGATQNALPNGTPITSTTNIVDAVYTVNYNGAGTPTAVATTLNLGWPASLEGAGFVPLTNFQIGISHFGGGLWGTYQQTSANHTAPSTVTLSGITSFSPFSVGKLGPAGTTLPIKVAYFNAAKGNGFNTLNWSAETSSPEVTFNIERSSDGVNFSTINSIVASQQRTSTPFDYTDNSITSGTVYYRIKIVEMNGKVSYTSVIRLATATNDIKLVGVLPNPVTNIAQLNIVSTKKDVVQLWVVSMEGKLVQRSTVQLQSGSSNINLDVTNLQTGMYTIKGTFSDGQTSSVKFVKQ